MEYNISDLTAEIKIAMDENVSSTALASYGDVDTLTLNEIISHKIENAARIVESIAPIHLLGEGESFGDIAIEWESAIGYGSGRLRLPADFMRLIVFQMSDWVRGVNMAITESDPLYLRQRSRYPGIRGCPQKPVVAVLSRPLGLQLEFFSCTSGEDVFVKAARYLPYPKVANGKIDLPEHVKDAVVYYTAYLSALSIGATDLASVMKATGDSILGIVAEGQ